MKNIFLLISVVVVLMTGCGKKSDKAEKVVLKPAADSATAASDTIVTNDELIQQAKTVFQYFKEKNYTALAELCAPEGVRFSPYAFIDVKKDVVLKPEQISEAGKSKQKFLWGQFDGSGEPISFTIKEYFSRFVQDVDFLTNSVISIDECLGGGNTTNNIRDAYKGQRFVSFYISGTEENANLDWKAIRIVFRVEKGQLLLIGVVHDEWTV